MAVTSGTTSTASTPAGSYSAYVTWTLVSQDVAGNYSTVKASLYFKTNQYGKTGVTHDTGSITINGTTSVVDDDFNSMPINTTKLIGTYQLNVPHNSDGTKTFAISGRWLHSGSTGTSFDLKPSGSFTLPDIKRASAPTLSVSTQAIGGVITITTNRQSTSFTHEITYVFGSRSGTIGTSVATSIAWTLPSTLAHAIPNTTSGKGTITVKTFNGTSLIGAASLPFTATVPTSYTASATTPAVSIYGSGKDNTAGRFIQGMSRAIVSYTATPSLGATITKTEWTVTCAPFSETFGGTSGNTNALTRAGTYTVKTSVVDSRGRTATSSTTFAVAAYEAPSITGLTADREAVETSIRAISTGKFSYISGVNTLTVTLQRAIGTSTTFTTIDTSTGATNGTFSLNKVFTGHAKDKSYTFKIIITDSLGGTASSLVSVSTAGMALSIHQDVGIGVGKIWERGTLDVAGSFYLNNREYIESGTNANGDWLRFDDGTQICYGEKTFTMPVSTTTGSVFGFGSGNYQTTVFAKPFVGKPFVTIRLEIGECLGVANRTVTSSEATWRAYFWSNPAGGTIKNVAYYAVGRWK